MTGRMPGRARALWLLPLLSLLVADCVSAQNRSLLEFYRSPSMLSREGVNRLSQAASEAISQQQQLPISALAPLEGAVDADQYKIGPNDVFSVSIGGAQPIQAQVPVGSDGTLVLPTVGALNVAGLPLSEARAIALDTLSSSFRNVPVDVALLQPRSFYVHVSGAVPEPGRYLALPASRVED
ncbi:MAG: polysaccharide biosynthesis/export family protein, partial [Bacteroidota bacterium]